MDEFPFKLDWYQNDQTLTITIFAKNSQNVSCSLDGENKVSKRDLYVRNGCFNWEPFYSLLLSSNKVMGYLERSFA